MESHTLVLFGVELDHVGKTRLLLNHLLGQVLDERIQLGAVAQVGARREGQGVRIEQHRHPEVDAPGVDRRLEHVEEISDEPFGLFDAVRGKLLPFQFFQGLGSDRGNRGFHLIDVALGHFGSHVEREGGPRQGEPGEVAGRLGILGHLLGRLRALDGRDHVFKVGRLGSAIDGQPDLEDLQLVQQRLDLLHSLLGRLGPQGVLLFGLVGPSLHAHLHAHLDRSHRHLAKHRGDVRYRNPNGQIVLFVEPVERLDRIGRGVGQHVGALGDEGPAPFFLFDVDRLVVHLDLHHAVSGVGGLARQRGQHLLEIGHGNKAEHGELAVAGLDDEPPRPLGIEPGQCRAGGSLLGYPLDHLSQLGVACQDADRLDVLENLVVARERDGHHRFRAAGRILLGGADSGGPEQDRYGQHGENRLLHDRGSFRTE